MNSACPEDVHCNMDEKLPINIQQAQVVSQKQFFLFFLIAVTVLRESHIFKIKLVNTSIKLSAFTQNVSF